MTSGMSLEQIKDAQQAGLVTVRSHWGDWTSENLVIVNYTRECAYSRAWNETTLACRGLILRLDKPWSQASRIAEVVALPFPKFFNYGESERYPESALTSVAEKMDGSLGILYRYKSEYWIATRGAFESEQAIWATNYLRDNYDLRALPDDWTLLFEIIYPENRVVVDYGTREDLVLLGIVNRYTGIDLIPEAIKAAAKAWKFSLPKTYSVDSIVELLESAETLEANFEGWVCRFSNGERYKIKGRGYLEMAKMLKGITPKKVLVALSDGRIDEMEKNLPEEMLPEIQSWRRNFQEQHATLVMCIEELYDRAPKDDARSFAEWVNSSLLNSANRSLMFDKFRGRDLERAVWKQMLKMQ